MPSGSDLALGNSRVPPYRLRSYSWFRLRLRLSCVLRAVSSGLCSSSLRHTTFCSCSEAAVSLATFLAFLRKLLLVQQVFELFIGKTTAETIAATAVARGNFYLPRPGHMPWHLGSGYYPQTKRTPRDSTLMRIIVDRAG